MSDSDYIAEISKSHIVELPDGSKKTLTIDGVFHHINNSLTQVFDHFFGPDQGDSFDASCNTCKHFQRKPMTPQEKAERNLYGMPGHCTKKDVPVWGWQRGQYCGFENANCYENRRTGMSHHEACRLKEEA